MMTFREWLARRQAMQSEGMLPKRSASNKRPKPLSAAVPTFKPYKPAQPPRIIPYKPAQPAKIVMQKPTDKALKRTPGVA